MARNPWQLPREGGGAGPTPITFPEASDDAAKYTAYIVSHVDELEVNVRRVAAILGAFCSYRRSPAQDRPGENGCVVEYRFEESVSLAAGFAIEGVCFPVKDPTAQAIKRETLLLKEYNYSVNEEDKEFSAVLSAGTKFGSRNMLKRIQEDEKIL